MSGEEAAGDPEPPATADSPPPGATSSPAADSPPSPPDFSQVPELAKKIHRAISTVRPIPMRGRSSQGYKYATDQDITSEARRVLAEVGVGFSFTELDRSIRKQPTSDPEHERGWRPMFVGHYRFTFFDAESGQSHSFYMSGESWATDDKAPQKALTGAKKSVLQTHLLLSSGADVDEGAPAGGASGSGGGESPTARKASQDQIDHIYGLANELASRLDEYEEADPIVNKAIENLGVDSVKHIYRDQADQLISELKEKIEALNRSGLERIRNHLDHQVLKKTIWWGEKYKNKTVEEALEEGGVSYFEWCTDNLDPESRAEAIDLCRRVLKASRGEAPEAVEGMADPEDVLEDLEVPEVSETDDDIPL